MIKLKNILLELKDTDISRLLNKINNKEYRFFEQGDNGRVYEIDGEDKLRVWLSLRCIESDNTIGSEPMLGFFVGITSATMRPSRKIDASGTTIDIDSDGMPTSWEIIPFTEADSYNSSNYGDDVQWNKFQFQDVGNLTTDDYRSYIQMVMNALMVVDE